MAVVKLGSAPATPGSSEGSGFGAILLGLAIAALAYLGYRHFVADKPKQKTEDTVAEEVK